MCVLFQTPKPKVHSNDIGMLHYKLHVHFNQLLLCFFLSQSLWLAVRKRSLFEHMDIAFIVQTGKNRCRNYLLTSRGYQPLLGRNITDQKTVVRSHTQALHASACVSATPLRNPTSLIPPNASALTGKWDVYTQAQVSCVIFCLHINQVCK